MQRRGLHGGFRHRLLPCLSRGLFIFFVVTFHPKRSNQRVAFQSWGLLSFLVTAAPLLALERSVGYLSDPAKSSENTFACDLALYKSNLTDWFIDWLVSWILLGTFLNMFSIVLTLQLLFCWTKAKPLQLLFRQVGTCSTGHHKFECDAGRTAYISHTTRHSFLVKCFFPPPVRTAVLFS